MDLAFTPEELKFRDEIRAWVKTHLPPDIASKVHQAQRLSRDDMQRWARILGSNGWLGYGWPKQFGGPGWTAVQKHLFEEECAMAGAPRIVPFGPVMVAPVIMAYGSPAQQQRVDRQCEQHHEPDVDAERDQVDRRRLEPAFLVAGQQELEVRPHRHHAQAVCEHLDAQHAADRRPGLRWPRVDRVRRLHARECTG